FVRPGGRIESAPRALQLLARAADGSMRDALSLTDQAIAMGQGIVSGTIVSQMLGTLDDEQPLGLIEALVEGSGEQVMTLLNQAASRGVEWEALLVEMLRLLHRIAMVQLLPGSINDEEESHAPRLRELARVVPPADVQLYYQTLLMGRKDLPLAPDRRMGVEMALLRALAFHPQTAIAEPVARPAMTPQAEPQPVAAPSPQTAAAQPQMAPPAPPPEPIAPPVAAPPAAAPDGSFSDTTSQLLQARTQLLRQGASKPKKSEPAASLTRPANSALERLASVTERAQARPRETAPAKKEAYRWKAQTQVEAAPEPVATPKALRSALEHEKTPELAARLMEEAQQRDAWAAEIAALPLPKLVQQLALNAWKESTEQGVCLHLRSTQRHLNSASAQQVLAAALSDAAGQPVELTIIEDDNPAVLTPLEWRQAIYEEKLAQARQSIISDTHIQTLRRFFDADLDEESIRPV
ncbi:DNA polymerase III subunit gamma/tau C-terminal domain-containing protein, partial [Pantoea piersonii]|uniref:DNA polymerase III subunit gamma/tau C-terminal domain-containing protein n=1 Tax=Pantoea piersonii TaxID=2364647 RepID=UPI001D86ABFC